MCLKKLLVMLAIVVAITTSCGAATIVDFDDLSLPDSESSWSGNYPSDGDTLTGEYTSFVSYGISFNNYSDGDTSYWEGFGYSNMSDTITPGYENDLSAYTGTGYNSGKDIYTVGYAGFYLAPTVTLPELSIVDGACFTNTTYAALAMRDGYFNARKFGGETGDEPDWFCLTVTGKDTQGEITNSIDFYLADYRFADNSEDYIIDTWEYVELSDLGEVKSLEFTLSSSDVGEYGINTPTYFAIDNLVVPEPSIILLLTFGGLFLRRRR